MKVLFLTLLITTTTWAQDEKIYTEKDFIKKVAEEVSAQVDKIKKVSVTDLTKELVKKNEEISLKELELKKREDALLAAEKELASKYIEVDKKQKQIIGCIDRNTEDEKLRITQVVDMISNMRPQKAAELLSVQDSIIAVQILQKIDAKKASKIFNFMDKDVSAKLQKQYLQMKK
ncbi:MAG TPA: hypothetical protein VKZ84_02645 [Bacteriovoracaceae bacterium]|nr:hypothetical protein [Bacteriovoracaceae bacterium]